MAIIGDNSADTSETKQAKILSQTCIVVTFGSSDLAIIRSYSSHKKVTLIGAKITPLTINPLTSDWNNKIRARHFVSL